MKYCAKCGTPMPDDAVACPQCHPRSQQQTTSKPKSNTPSRITSSKNFSLILANIVISALTLITVIVMYFIPPISNGSATNNVFNSTCPAAEYGYHDWSPARCTQPSHCYECGAYKDDKLGEHDFYVNSDGINKCMYCGILYEVYINSLNQ